MVCLAFFFHTGAAMLTISMTQSHLGSGGECKIDVENAKQNGLWDEKKGRCEYGHTDETVTDNSETCGCPAEVTNRCRCIKSDEHDWRRKCTDEVATDYTVLFGVCCAIVVAASFGFIILFKKCRNVKIVKIKQKKMRKYRQKAFEEDQALKQRSSGTQKDSESSPVSVITPKPDEEAPEEEEVRLAAGHPVWLWSLFILAIVLVTQFITLTAVSGAFLYYHRKIQQINLYHAGCYDTLTPQ